MADERTNIRRAELSARLRVRRTEIEQATLAYIDQQTGADGLDEPTYAEGLREAISAALNLGFQAIEHGEQDLQVPTALLEQARAAVQNGVQLETVIQRYVVGYTLLGNFVMEETEEGDLLTSAELRRIRRMQAAVFNRVVAEVSAEYRREQMARVGTAEQSRIDLVKRLLGGDVLDTSSLEYDFDLVHLGLIALGPAADVAIHAFAKALDRRWMVIRVGEQTYWGWLGGGAREDLATLKHAVTRHWPSQLRLSLGEQVHGIDGWRLTHRQASAAFRIAMHTDTGQIHYADVALLASISADELLATSLRRIYLEPLSRDRDGGEVLCQTLRAYFDADRTVSSAAAALGVTRQTVGNRLRVVEEKLGRSLTACGPELDAALRLKELKQPASGSMH